MGEQVDLLVERLRSEGDAALARLATLSLAQWDKPVYGEGAGWKARDILAHLVAAERGHQRLIAAVAAGEAGSPPDFDIDRYNRSTVAALSNRSVSDLLVDLQAVRRDTIALVAGLSDDDLARRGNHPALGSGAALADFVRIVFMHVKLHLRDLARALSQD